MTTINNKDNSNPFSIPLSAQVEAFFKGTDAISYFSEQIIIPQMDAVQKLSKLSEKDPALFGTYYRMYLWIRSLTVLNRPLYFQTVASATRSLVELLFDFKLLQADDSGEKLKQYFQFPEVRKLLMAERLVSFCEQHSGKTKLKFTNQKAFLNNGTKRTQIENNVRTLWGTKKNGDPNFPDHWSGMDARSRAKHLDALCKTNQHEELYIESYPLGSLYIHPDPTGHISLSADTFESTFGLCHSIVQRVFLEVTVLFAEETKISFAVSKFKEIIQDLRINTGRLLLDEQIEFIKSQTQSPAP